MKIEFGVPALKTESDRMVYARLLKRMGYSKKEISNLIPSESQSKPVPETHTFSETNKSIAVFDGE